MSSKLLSIFIVLWTISLNAQQNYIVNASIKSEDGQPLTGNVLVLNTVDSGFVRGAFFLDGHIQIELDQKEALLKLTSIEFEDKYIPISNPSLSNIDLGEIIVRTSTAALSEVVVEGRRPKFVRKADGSLELQVENTALSRSSNVFDVLSMTPDIVVGDDGMFSLVGRGELIYYLNDKRITVEQLSMIPPSSIQSIEVIRNPSVRYDSEGAAVLHIRTIKGQNEGYRVQMNQNVSYSNFGGILSESAVNAQWDKGSFHINSFLSLQLGEEREVLETTRDRLPENGFINTNVINDYRREFTPNGSYGLGVHIDLNEKSYFSTEYSGRNQVLKGNRLSTNSIVDLVNITDYSTIVQMDQQDVNHTVSANYGLTLDSMGSDLFLGVQYSGFNISNQNPIEETASSDQTSRTRYIRNNQNLDIQFVTGQADYNQFLSSQISISTGFKYSSLRNTFYAKFLVSEDNENFQLDEDFSNTFDYEEDIAAAYSSFNHSISDRLSYNVGLRMEYTKYNLFDSRVDQYIGDTYVWFFPKASVNWELDNNRTFSFSYQSRLRRPRYENLNPVLVYQDPFTGVQGNPNLRPERIHTWELNTRFSALSILLGYAFTDKPFGGGALRGDTDRSYILIRFNDTRKQEYYFSLGRNFSSSWIESKNTFYLTYMDIINDEVNFRRVKPRPNVYFSTSNTVFLGRQWRAELLFWYMGVNRNGLFDRNAMNNLTVSLEKSLLDDRLKLRLTANDVLNGFIASGDYHVEDTDIYFRRQWSTDYFRISINYNLGRLKKVGYKNKNVGQSETDRVSR